MKPTLFLLAAGMGSRYGGLKQLDGLGPNGETIMDYSIYDAIQAGFGKIVWVIRRDFEEQFRNQVLKKYEGHIPCELCFQALDDLPEGFTVKLDDVALTIEAGKTSARITIPPQIITGEPQTLAISWKCNLHENARIFRQLWFVMKN